MNSIKRSFRLFGGAGTILLNVFILISALAMIALYSGRTGLTAVARAEVNLIIGVSIALAVLSVIAVIVAVLLCLNRMPKTMATILIVMLSIMAVLEFMGSIRSGGVNMLELVYGILCFVVAGILVAYMFAKTESTREHSAGRPIQTQKHTASSSFEAADADDFTATIDNDPNDGFDDTMY